MLDIKIQKKRKKGELSFDGQLDLDNAQHVKEEFANALKAFKEIVLHFDKVTRIDFSFIQLLYSLRLSAVALKKTVALGRGSQEKLLPLLQAYGFTEEGLDSAVQQGQKNQKEPVPKAR